MIKWDLQQFAGEKTEKPTPRKLQDARQKGQVPRSPDLASALILLGSLLAIKLLGGFYISNFSLLLQANFSEKMYYSLTGENVHMLFQDIFIEVAKLCLPIIGVVFVIGFFANYLQVGSIFSVEPITPKLSKLNPIEGFKRIFSQRTLVELVKSLLKVALIGYVVYATISAEVPNLSGLMRMEIPDILARLGDVTFSVLWKSILVMLVLALFDYLYQRYDHTRSLRMSKDDLKEEYKKTEGDPTIKGKIKERQRAMAMRRMMQDVPKADVVITNPTHFAIALRYDASNMEAPVILAKGMDEVAQRIKQVARENGVTLVENRPLAQTLFRTTEIGGTVPAELFQAVAEVLAYVYRLKRKV